MVSKVYDPLVAITAVLLSFGTSVVLAHVAGIPAPELVVPGVFFAFVLSRRPGGEPTLERLAAAAGFSLLAGVGVWAGSQLPHHPVAGGAAIVVLMAGSIWARRFGPVATRLGAMVPLALLALLIVSGTAGPELPWWPRCGWGALVGLSAFCWVRAVRWWGEKIIGDASPAVRPATARRSQARAGKLSVSTRMALQMALALAVALTAGHLLFGPHWQWCAISALVVNTGTVGRGDLALKGAERGLGAMAGTGFAAVLAIVAQPRGAACVVLIFVVLAATSGLRQYTYAGYAAGITTAMSLLYGYFCESAQHLLVIRLEALGLGAAIAVLVGWFLLPVRAGDVLRARLGAALAALGAFLEAWRAGKDTAAALAVFDAAANNVAISTRPHRLHRFVRRLIGAYGGGTSRGAHPADAGDALLGARAAAHALAATSPDAGERAASVMSATRAAKATSATIGILRRALADSAGVTPELPEHSARHASLADIDAALAQLARTIPAIARHAAPRARARAGAGAGASPSAGAGVAAGVGASVKAAPAGPPNRRDAASEPGLR